MRNHLNLPVLCLIGLGVTTGAKGLTIPASEDTTGFSTTKLSPSGSKAPMLMVDSTHKAYVYFNLDDVPRDAVLRWAKLRLFLPTVRSAGSGLGVHVVTSQWDEIQPANQPTRNPAPVATIGAEKLGPRRFVTADVTGTVQEWIFGTSINEGFAIVPLSGGAAGLASLSLTSKEGAAFGLPAELDLDFMAPAAGQAAAAPAAMEGGAPGANVLAAVAQIPFSELPIAIQQYFSPKVVSQPKVSSDQESLVSTVEGLGRLTYQWYVNGGAVAGGTSASLSLAGLTSGTYSLKASNEFTSVTSDPVQVERFTLTMTAQPSFSLASGSIGGAAINGLRPLTYLWYRTGTPVAVGTSATLSLAGLPSDTYRLTASDGFTSVTSAGVAFVRAALTLTKQPSVSITSGTLGGATITGQGPLTYQWYRNGVPVTGGTAASLPLAGLQSGTYAFFATDDLTSVTSEGVPFSPAESLIPAGTFIMGNNNTGDGREHSVTLSAFSIGKTEVTFEEWTNVKTWAEKNNYVFGSYGRGSGLLFPVTGVTWHDVLKWINAKSEMEGLTPAYYIDSNKSALSVYRTGQVNLTNAMVDWTASGYRLPTEAEWERAARGGFVGRPFPNGTTLSASEANFTTRGTKAVKSYAPNGYDLYDMTGNVWEWCWDWHGDYSGDATDPRGPETGASRVLRGGGWNYASDLCRVSSRATLTGLSYACVGFRLVRKPTL